MYPSLRTEIRTLLTEARAANRFGGGSPHLSDVVAKLERLEESVCLGLPSQFRLARSLGRLVVGDVRLAKSPLGLALMQLVDDVAALPLQ